MSSSSSVSAVVLFRFDGVVSEFGSVFTSTGGVSFLIVGVVASFLTIVVESFFDAPDLAGVVIGVDVTFDGTGVVDD